METAGEVGEGVAEGGLGHDICGLKPRDAGAEESVAGR